ncbi:Zn-ribbon domain-containing OB-fold protein [Novosphingobium sp. G106]|uniref:Zn-ribbon domain-containing OB-fold protein n=1 Tax=Novosphingobium sp. G106 TaxID=2849500 RepID=UPI0020C2E9FB|nr:OB-fold domain-containing protein [Novosphingobium sp. G106]
MTAIDRHQAPEETPRQLPLLDSANRAFWQSGADGHLRICRCADCRAYTHPPQPRCSFCRSAKVQPEPVSGRGRVKTFTVNVQAWTPVLSEPFVFAAVELEEQFELYVLTNIVNCPVEAVTIDMPVEVLFEEREDVFLPLFQPREVGR